MERSSGFSISWLYDHSSRPFQTHHSACDTATIQDTFVIIDYKGKKKKKKQEVKQRKLRPGATLRFVPSPNKVSLAQFLAVCFSCSFLCKRADLQCCLWDGQL